MLRIPEKEITDIALDLEDDIFDELRKQRYDKYHTVDELYDHFNVHVLIADLFKYFTENSGMDYDEIEEIIEENNLLYKILYTKNIVKLFKDRVGAKTMNCHKPMPRHKNSIEKLENSVRRMF